MFKYTIVLFLGLFATLANSVPVRIIPRQSNVGDVTFFTPGLGACGVTNYASDLVVAVSSQFFERFGSQSNGNPICGRQIQATAPGGQSVTATVWDVCPGCNVFDLDMSPAAFNSLADPSVGRIHDVSWNLL